MIFRKQLKPGSFILYRDKTTPGEFKPARVQSSVGAVVGLSEIIEATVKIDNAGEKLARIVCGPVKWLEAARLKIIVITEAEILRAQTTEGLKNE